MRFKFYKRTELDEQSNPYGKRLRNSSLQRKYIL